MICLVELVRNCQKLGRPWVPASARDGGLIWGHLLSPSDTNGPGSNRGPTHVLTAVRLGRHAQFERCLVQATSQPPGYRVRRLAIASCCFNKNLARRTSSLPRRARSVRRPWISGRPLPLAPPWSLQRVAPRHAQRRHGRPVDRAYAPHRCETCGGHIRSSIGFRIFALEVGGIDVSA